MGKGYNNYMTKKPFHPGSKANIKRTWMAEQRTENEKRKQEELKAQYEKEQDLYNNRALLSTESKDKLELNFMYEAPPGAKRERQKEDDEPEYKFEWQRKYNAPREDYAKGNADIRDQPFGIPVRNVRCIKCHKWGHVNTDRECPMFNSTSASSMPTTSMDPLELMRQMREDGYNLKQSVLGHQVNLQSANQRYVHSDNEGEDPEMKFLKSLTSKQKKKLLKKLNKLSKKQKKNEAKKKIKKDKVLESSDSESEEEQNKKKNRNMSSSNAEQSNVKDSEEKHAIGFLNRRIKEEVATKSRRDLNLKDAKKLNEEPTQGAEDSADSNKNKKQQNESSREKDGSSHSKQKTSKHHDTSHRSHKKKKESRKHKDSDSESSEDDNSRRTKRKLPDAALDFNKPKKFKKDDDISDNSDSSPKKDKKKHGEIAANKEKDVEKNKEKHDAKHSDSGSSPEKEKKILKDKSSSESDSKKQSKPIKKIDNEDLNAASYHSSKKHHKNSHKTLEESGSTSTEGKSHKTSSNVQIKTEKKVQSISGSPQKTENVLIKKSPHSKEEAVVRPSTSKQQKSGSSSDDEDKKDKFAKPSKFLRTKSPSADRSSPEHPDRFSHRNPQQRKQLKEGEEQKYLGHNHDRFRDQHRHRRSPSVKHKYKP